MDSVQTRTEPRATGSESANLATRELPLFNFLRSQNFKIQKYKSIHPLSLATSSPSQKQLGY